MHAVIVLLRILIALRIVSEAEEILKVPPRADRCIYIKRFLSVIRRKNSLIDKALYIVVPDTVLVGKG